MAAPATATASGERAAAPRPSSALIQVWLGVLLAPASWVADLLARYFLIRFANVRDTRWPLHLPTVFFVALLLVGAGLCWRVRRQERAASTPAATLATWGLWLAAFFLLLMLAQAYPAFVLSAREIT